MTIQLISVFAWMLHAAPVFSPSVLDDKTFSETNTVIAYLDDGTYIQAQLAISNLGLRGGRGACRALMVRPGSPSWNADKIVDRDAWFAGTVPAPNLHVGACKATATRQATTLDVQLEGTSISIALAAAAKSVTPPGFPIRHDDTFYESDILVPFAPAEVVLAPAQGVEQVLHGYGYADHSRSTSLPKDLARGWVRFRGFSNKCARVLLLRLPPQGGPAAGFWWRQGTPAPDALSQVNVELPAEDTLTTAAALTLHAGERVIKLTSRRHLFRDAPLEEHGVLGRMVGAFVGSVVTHTYEADFDDGSACGPVLGILEVERLGG